MPVSDPIADLIARMRNAQHARYDACRCPWSRHKQEVCEVLKEKEFLHDVLVEGEGVQKQLVVVFDATKPALELKRVSKPGRRVYSSSKDLKPVLHGYGVAVVSTNQGVMTDVDARSRGLGGEVLCTVS